jgi:hypothetical protein
LLLQEPEAQEGLEEQEAPRKTRRQQQAAAAAEAQQQPQGPVRSTRSRSSKQQQQQQEEDLVVQAQQHEQGEEQQQDKQQQGDQLDDFQQDAELADSIQGLLQQSEVNPVLLLRPNADMADATRRAAKVGVGLLTFCPNATAGTFFDPVCGRLAQL